MATPRLELWLVADGEAVDLVGGNPQALRQAAEGDYLGATIPAETLITGNALGITFELTASQHEALRTFVARARPADPANGR